MGKSYRDLLIWQKGMEIVSEVYLLTKDFPKEEVFGLTSQIKRSSVSIPSNIAEGWGRETTKSFASFLRISRGSLYELETQIEIAKNLNILKAGLALKLEGLMLEESKMLISYLNKIK